MNTLAVHIVLALVIAERLESAFLRAANARSRDTVYLLPPVVVTATQAHERETPVTFTDLKHRDILSDIPCRMSRSLLSELPSITTYSENGNGIGYNYVNLRGFDQRRISVMVNGIPQNDPEDHNVYWIDFPDLMASTDLIQVQRGAGSAFYGPAAIGGSINLVTNPFSGRRASSLESSFGFQQYADSSRSLPLIHKRLSASFTSGAIGGHYLLLWPPGDDHQRRVPAGIMGRSGFLFLRCDQGRWTMTTRFISLAVRCRTAWRTRGFAKFANNDPVLRRQNLTGWETTPDGLHYTSVTASPAAGSGSVHPTAYRTDLHEWKLASDRHSPQHDLLLYRRRVLRLRCFMGGHQSCSDSGRRTDTRPR